MIQKQRKGRKYKIDDEIKGYNEGTTSTRDGASTESRVVNAKENINGSRFNVLTNDNDDTTIEETIDVHDLNVNQHAITSTNEGAKMLNSNSEMLDQHVEEIEESQKNKEKTKKGRK